MWLFIVFYFYIFTFLIQILTKDDEKSGNAQIFFLKLQNYFGFKAELYFIFAGFPIEKRLFLSTVHSVLVYEIFLDKNFQYVDQIYMVIF